MTTHNPCNGRETKILLAESNNIVVFPKTSGAGPLKYILTQYLGLDSKQVDIVKKIQSRSVCITRGYPMIMTSENLICLLHEI